MKETIKDFYGKILGFVETQPNGNKTATDFYGRIVGFYKKDQDITTDFYGRIIARGDCVVGLIPRNLK